MNKVAAFVVNYNMPEAADRYYEGMLPSAAALDVFVIDNGSDIMPPAKHTAISLPQNVQTTRGWLAGWEHAKALKDYYAYMFLITSAEVAVGDPAYECVSLLESDPNAVICSPALTADSTTAWRHMKTRMGGNRRTWMVDNICSMYRAEWFDKNPFDSALTFGWGIDIENCWKARKEGRSIWICEGAQVRKITDIGYTMNRMNMSAQERIHYAGENMRSVLIPRYGPAFWEKLTTEFVSGELR